MKKSGWLAALAAATLVGCGADGETAYRTLRGSHAKMVRQNMVAREDRLEFARTPQDIERLVQTGQLAPLPQSGDYVTKRVAFPFAQPQVLACVEQVAHDYRVACGEPLVITSMTRPLSMQPRNASPLSVHPAGIAVDLHLPERPACRRWLAERLLTLASYNILDVTEEKHPPHLHVAVFPRAYAWWAGRPLRVARLVEASLAARSRSVTARRTSAARVLAGVVALLAVLGMAWVLAKPIRARVERREGSGGSSGAQGEA